MTDFKQERRFSTSNEAETLALGATLAAMLQPPRMVILKGELGTGKTTLVKGIVAALGAGEPRDVLSPTFTLVHEYTGEGGRIFHLDLYRLETERELATLGLDEMVEEGDALLLVEWGERFAGVLQRADAMIEIRRGEREDERLFLLGWRET